MIMDFNNFKGYILSKLENLSTGDDLIDFIIIVKYIQNQLGNYYSYQFYYTLNYLLNDVNIEIYQF